MKVLLQFQCEICGIKHDEATDALKCEGVGKFRESTTPIGLMWYNPYNFEVAQRVFAVSEIDKRGHKATFYHYFFTVLSLSESHISYATGFTEKRAIEFFKEMYIGKRALALPAFGKMVAFLQSKGITPTYYNEKGELVTVKPEAYGETEGEVCNRPQSDGTRCKGIIQEEEGAACYCHATRPPCSACTEDNSYCPECGYHGSDRYLIS